MLQAWINITWNMTYARIEQTNSNWVIWWSSLCIKFHKRSLKTTYILEFQRQNSHKRRVFERLYRFTLLFQFSNTFWIKWPFCQQISHIDVNRCPNLEAVSIVSYIRFFHKAYHDVITMIALDMYTSYLQLFDEYF